MSYGKQEKTEMVLNKLKEEDGIGVDLDNISLESATVNKKSYLRIFEGVDLT
jgi:hypothetical protein